MLQKLQTLYLILDKLNISGHQQCKMYNNGMDLLNNVISDLMASTDDTVVANEE